MLCEKIHCCCLVSKLCLTFVTPWTVAHQVLLSMGFPRQEYWSQLPFPSPGIFLTQGLTHVSCIGRKILYQRATEEDQRRYIGQNEKKKKAFKFEFLEDTAEC